MKKIALVAALVLGFAFVATPSEAEAKDMTGRFGVGADSSLGWSSMDPATGLPSNNVPNTGLSVVYYITKMFGLQLTVASQVYSASGDGDYEGSAFAVGVGVRALVPIAFTNDVNLTGAIGFSGIFAGGNANTPDVDEDDPAPSFVSFDLALRPEWFITDHFSIHTQVGIAISLLNEDNIGVPGGGGVDANIFNNADLLGNAGFTFWF